VQNINGAGGRREEETLEYYASALSRSVWRGQTFGGAKGDEYSENHSSGSCIAQGLETVDELFQLWASPPPVKVTAFFSHIDKKKKKRNHKLLSVTSFKKTNSKIPFSAIAKTLPAVLRRVVGSFLTVSGNTNSKPRPKLMEAVN